jgi:hypothetical protein
MVRGSGSLEEKVAWLIWGVKSFAFAMERSVGFALQGKLRNLDC